MPKLTDYELEREKNIARNRALLEELELDTTPDQSLGVPPKPAPSKTKAKPIQPTLKRKREVADVPPPRRSTRNKFVADPNETPAQRKRREKEHEERRKKEEKERIEAEERARIARLPRHDDLDLPTLAEDHEESDINRLQATIVETAKDEEKDPSAFDFESDTKEDSAVKELRDKLQGLKVVSRAKVTQDRIYSAAYHPEPTKDLIFFGDKHGQLGIWDARATPDEVADEDEEVSDPDNREGGKYWRLQLHWPATSKSSISCVKVDPTNTRNIYTSAYDCTLRSLSFESGISTEIASFDETMVTSFDMPSTGNEMWIADADGKIMHIDLREAAKVSKGKGNQKIRSYQLSEHKIGAISINPMDPSFIVTASNSRLLKIWDTRALAAIQTKSAINEFDTETISSFLETKKGKMAFRGEWQHDKSVSSAYWSPHGRSVVSTSYDDSIRIWDLDTKKLSSTLPRPFSRIKHNCQTGKWLTILRAQWSQNLDFYPHFTIGNMNHSLDIFSGRGTLVARLADSSKITAVQAVTASHPRVLERAVSGNASGRCVLWAPPDVD